ncbi:MAG: phasin family protein [Acidobacteriota bacterium]
MSTREPLNDRLQQAGSEVREAGRNVWLAGLGVAHAVDQRGREVFQELVGRGEKMDVKTDLELMRPVREASDRVRSLGQNLERRAEKGVSLTLERLGMPSRRDVQQLVEQVEQLNLKVESLSAR